MNKIIIGLAGQKQSGKSTATLYTRTLISIPIGGQLKCQPMVYSFADPLKDFCIKTLGLTYKQCYGTDEEKNSLTNHKWENVDIYFRKKYGKVINIVEDIQGPTVEPRKGFMTAREVMQVQGEMQRKFFCKDMWVDALFREIDNNAGSVALIQDVRHENEVKKCSDSGYVIHLKKLTNNDSADSEAELKKIDWKSYPNVFEIDNTNLTIEEKNEKIKEILFKIPGLEKFLK